MLHGHSPTELGIASTAVVTSLLHRLIANGLLKRAEVLALLDHTADELQIRFLWGSAQPENFSPPASADLPEGGRNGNGPGLSGSHRSGRGRANRSAPSGD